MARHGIGNLPGRAETFVGIAELATNILDPLREEFGQVILTYGFAGPSLTRSIKRKISPPHDQHAGSEVNLRGALICGRQGQACDLHVPGRSSLEVSQWIRGHLPFDRLYLYGARNAVHVSHGPEQAGKVYAMLPAKKGRMPRDVTNRAPDEIARLVSGV